MADQQTTRMLADILAKQDAAAAQGERILSKLDEQEKVLGSVLNAIISFAHGQATMREAIDKLAAAANQDNPTGDDLAKTIRAILEKLTEQTDDLKRAADGIDRLNVALRTKAAPKP